MINTVGRNFNTYNGVTSSGRTGPAASAGAAGLKDTGEVLDSVSLSNDAATAGNCSSFTGENFADGLSSFAFGGDEMECSSKNYNEGKVEDRIDDLWAPCIIGGAVVGGILGGPVGAGVGSAIGAGAALVGGSIWGGMEEAGNNN